jgi:Flp pilus assembly protein TadD
MSCDGSLYTCPPELSISQTSGSSGIIRGMRIHACAALALSIVAGTGIVAAQQPPAAADPSADLLRQAQQRMREGNEDEAVTLARRAVAASPQSFAANNQAGSLLDLAGQYADARNYFQKAADLAPAAENKNRALRAIAISYGFEGNCPGATKYEEPLYRQYLDAKDFYNAGEVANELARLCLDAGRIDEAERWYRTGTEAGLKEPDIKADRQDLWHYRLEHALARIAARRGNKPEAEKHVQAAKEILDRGNMPAQQKEYFPYLAGYVALYTGDAQAALTQLLQGNQNDPYVLGLIGQACEKLGQQDKAMEYYRKVMAATIHNPTSAGSRPLARQRLAARK